MLNLIFWAALLEIQQYCKGY